MYNSQSTTQPIATGATSKTLESVIALCFGIMIVAFVGFSHLEIVHNAAHDVRHANGFPCH